MPFLLSITDIPADAAIGGKASGLQQLAAWGFPIPPTWVLPADQPIPSVAELTQWLAAQPHQRWAVRSSATGEDGQQASFAGQFETFLNVTGAEAIVQAIQQCRESAEATRVQQYNRHKADTTELQVAVVLQAMVEAQWAGVIFTIDPVQNFRDRGLVQIVEGLGDKLVGGEASGESFVFSRQTQHLPALAAHTAPLPDLPAIVSQAMQMEQQAGQPVDAEFAIDAQGQLYWLQCRPITTLAAQHANSLDTPLPEPAMILTRCNVGEMMPGAVTPLTFSVFGRAIDLGLQDLYYRIGALPRVEDKPYFVNQFYGHLYLNMSQMYKIVDNVWLTRITDINLSIAGGPLPEGFPSHHAQPKSIRKRLTGFIQYIGYFNNADKRLADLIRLEQDFQLPPLRDLASFFEVLTQARDTLCLAYSYHYNTSGQSGAYYATLLKIFSGNAQYPQAAHHQWASALLSQVEGIESANALESLTHLAAQLAANPEACEKALKSSPQQLLDWLQEPAAAGHLAELFAAFMQRHGHRCIREAELREKEWRKTPLALVEVLQNQVALLQRTPTDAKASTATNHYAAVKAEILQQQTWGKRLALRYLLSKARAAVAKRERSKSLCISLQAKIKAGYHQLAEVLVAQQLLTDEDQIFFLTHPEIARLIHQKDLQLLAVAEARRKLYPQLMALQFDDFSVGVPEPLDLRQIPPVPVDPEGVLRGVPVSLGLVEGVVRIVNSVEDARQIQQGEIVITAYTDIGWTPYFALMGGLVTEIGSPLSHGAVVAREYGLPAVVNVKNARKLLKTGDRVCLDGSQGTISPLP